MRSRVPHSAHCVQFSLRQPIVQTVLVKSLTSADSKRVNLLPLAECIDRIACHKTGKAPLEEVSERQHEA